MATKPTYEELEQKVKALEKRILFGGREHSKSFRDIFIHAPIGIGLADAETGEILDANDKMLQVIGFSREDLLNQNVTFFYRNADDRKTLLKQIEDHGFVRDYEVELKRKNGETYYGKVNINSITINSRICFLTSIEDISNCKRAKEALRKREEKYQLIIETVTHGVQEVDTSGKTMFTNSAYHRMLGYESGELIGRSMYETQPDDSEKKKLRDYVQILIQEQPKPEPYFAKVVKKNGDTLDVQTDWNYKRNSQGDVSGFISIITDITERKRAKDALQKAHDELEMRVEERTEKLVKTNEAMRKSEEKYRSLVESTEDSIYLVDKDGTYLFMNEKHLSRLGPPADKAIGKTYGEFHPLDDTKEFVGKIEKIFETGEAIQLEHRSIRDDRYFLRTLSPVKDPDGNTISVTVVSKDITARKRAEEALRESEEKYRSMMEAMKDPVYICSPDFRVEYMNPAMIRRTGRDAIGEHCFKVLHGLDEKCSWCMHAKAQQGEYLESEIVSPQDNRSYHVSQSSIVHEDGSISKMTVFRDTTDLKKLETQLQQAQKMEAIGTLAGGVAHDLNNILGGLVSYPELLLLQLPEDSPLRKSILTIQKSGEKAAAVVQDLLTLARRGVVVTEVVNPNDVIAEYLKSPEHENLQSYHHGVHIETHLEKDSLNILGSSTHLSKTVMNLVSNAAEAMPQGGKLTISTENRYIDRPIRGYEDVVEGDYVVLAISDTGAGIAPDDIGKIFEPFYTKKKMGRSGTGLGMAVVWGTVKDHNGYIDVQSTEGTGTTFTLYFPVTRKELPEDKSHLAIGSYSGHGESILIVDDVEQQRNIASGMLKELGYSVVSVPSGEEALEYLKTNKVDLLVLDMIMDPGMDGLDTYKKILEIYPGQKAIIASGFSETDRVKEVQSLGAGAYIRKPLLLEKVGLAVKEELEK